MTTEPASPPEGGQGAEGANVQVSPPAAPPADANASPPSPPAPPTYHSTFEDPQERGYVETKGWKTQSDLLKSYRNLETMRGVPPERLLTLPENTDDAEAMKPIYEKLGLAAPAAAEDYGFVAMEGAEPEVAKSYADLALKHGIPPKMAKAVFADILAMEKQGRESLATEVREETAAELGRLQGEWGARYDENVEIARRAVRRFGFSEQELQAMETNLGAATMYKRFHAVGQSLNEGTFIEGEKPKNGFALGADGARAERDRLMSDKDFMAKYLGGNLEAKQRMSNLNQIIAGGQAKGNAP